MNKLFKISNKIFNGKYSNKNSLLLCSNIIYLISNEIVVQIVSCKLRRTITRPCLHGHKISLIFVKFMKGYSRNLSRIVLL